MKAQINLQITSMYNAAVVLREQAHNIIDEQYNSVDNVPVIDGDWVDEVINTTKKDGNMETLREITRVVEGYIDLLGCMPVDVVSICLYGMVDLVNDSKETLKY